MSLQTQRKLVRPNLLDSRMTRVWFLHTALTDFTIQNEVRSRNVEAYRWSHHVQATSIPVFLTSFWVCEAIGTEDWE